MIQREVLDTKLLETIFMALAAVGGLFAGFMSHRSRKDVKDGKMQLDGISLKIGEVVGGLANADAERRQLATGVSAINFNLGGVKQQVEHVERTLGNFGERLGTVEHVVSNVGARLGNVESNCSVMHKAPHPNEGSR